TGASTITLKSGLLDAEIAFAAGGKESSNVVVDSAGEFTEVEEYDTSYSVDRDIGAVTVKSNDIDITGTKYEALIGAAVYVDKQGKLTTGTTSQGDTTVDPLKALDKALASVDSLRSDLGAIQNRFESTITILNNTVTNLSSARSRIEDAD